ncbi:exo-beta-N-acetylmuramidase NamZ family protein [Sanyastnella coralliicola]|uniref:exo-beta-N-acetylmuramidase NamZ family protein n=1 Tax=Sanyastnella coralliicola TaxID=3069118 RepID=UPI0027B8D337|nr:DUF1343 domain-containing protein [Longitalea sp. SCSIO 12813]
MRTLLILFFLPIIACGQVEMTEAKMNDLKLNAEIKTGASQFDRYLPLLENKNVGIVANHTSIIGEAHLVDELLGKGVSIHAVYAPEHGFRGDAANGEKVENGKDPSTGLTIYSLYGKTKKPTKAMLEGVDVMIFDMQDVGARFYTYLSTMHYVMEASAEADIPVIVLDRPNPNGFYVDGPVLEEGYESFVGMHPIPIVHGMTLGELARMINGEGWLANGIQCDLTVISCSNYRKSDLYELPVAPSPNLQSMEAVYLYPSLCLFEPTIISIGRGTEQPFEIYGHPDHKYGSLAFTPESMPGKSLHPKHEGETCYGQNLKEFGSFYFQANKQLYLGWFMAMYESFDVGGEFYTSPKFFDKLAGTGSLRQMISDGASESEIRASWKPGLEAFMEQRKPYLLYAGY